METSWAPLSFSIHVLIFLTLFIPSSIGQLTPKERRALFQLENLLELPQVLQNRTTSANFCDLPPIPSLVIICTGNRITQLTIVGNFSFSGKILSEKFSIGSVFTTLTKLSNLTRLSLVSLGIWGSLPQKAHPISSLEVLNISSNHIYGEIPVEIISSFGNLKSLVLANNLLNGSVPDLRGLAVLEELDLGGNQLVGKFPALGRNLSTVILRNNSLRSDIPEELEKLDRLVRFDISSNKFVGPVSPSLFSLPSIEYLNLAENELTGALPASTSCSDGLKFIDISRNLLMGKLPTCIVSDPLNRTALYSWNCFSTVNSSYQHPHAFCDNEALAVKPPIQEEHGSRIKLGVVLGIIGGCIGAAGALGLLIFTVFRRTKAKKDEHNILDGLAAENKVSGHGYPMETFDARHMPRTMRSPAALGLLPYHVLTLEEIEDVTNNFDESNLMEEGSQGQLFKGSLRNGALVLVKCLEVKQKYSPQILSQYVEVISRLRHPNLVSVLGHCIVTYDEYPGSSVFIILEDISSGSLKDHLSEWGKREMLKWPHRMSMAMGIARGVQFLHTRVAPGSGIFGNDLRIENILLDENLTPKISNYNTPSLAKVGSESPLNGRGVSHTLSSVEFSEKNDVYQLGKILVELITGRALSTDAELYELIHQLESGLTGAPSALRGAADSAIQGTFAYQSLRTTVEIAVNCLCEDRSKRPSMEDVIWNLQYSFQVQEGWNGSENLDTKPIVAVSVEEEL